MTFASAGRSTSPPTALRWSSSWAVPSSPLRRASRPAAFPGFSPYCPYTVARGGGWTAPDMARARRLVAESGTAGATVVVEIPEWQRPVGAYFVSLLRDLGFRARANVARADEYFEGIYRPGSRAQMGWAGWVADYLSAATFIEPLFGCPTRADRHAENTPPLLREGHDGDPARAVERPDDAAAAWAVADRRIVDLAAAVPYVDGRTAVFVSKRVGNVTHHPQFDAAGPNVGSLSLDSHRGKSRGPHGVQSAVQSGVQIQRNQAQLGVLKPTLSCRDVLRRRGSRRIGPGRPQVPNECVRSLRQTRDQS